MTRLRSLFWLGVALALSASAGADESKTETAPIDENEPGLVRQIGLDFRNVFTTKENLWILGVGAGASVLVHPFDASIPRSPFNDERNEGSALDRTFESGEVLGGTLFQAGAATAAFAIGRAIDDPGLASLKVPEWDDQEVRIALEEDAAMTAEGKMEWILRRQERFHLIR